MENKKSNVLILIVMALVAFNLFTTNSIKTDVEEYNTKIDSIQTIVDSINDLNVKLDGRIDSLHSEIELVDKDIDKVQTNITVIKQNTNEKVRSISHFGDDELELFFAEWARKHADSIN